MMSPKSRFLTTRRKNQIQSTIKKNLDINTYNQYLFIFETILLLGAIQEYIEGWVVGLDINFSLNVILVMLLIGSVFTIAVRFLEPLTRRLIISLIRFKKQKAFRIALHTLILFCLFLLYSWVYFDTIMLH